MPKTSTGVFLTSAVLVFALSSSSAAAASTDTGNDLLRWCAPVDANLDDMRSLPDDSLRAYNSGLCLGWISGIVDMNMLYRAKLRMAGVKVATLPVFCSPDGFTNGQGIRVLVKYLKEHPEKLNEHALFLTAVAFAEAWPCPGNPVPK